MMMVIINYCHIIATMHLPFHLKFIKKNSLNGKKQTDGHTDKNYLLISVFYQKKNNDGDRIFLCVCVYVCNWRIIHFHQCF